VFLNVSVLLSRREVYLGFQLVDLSVRGEDAEATTKLKAAIDRLAQASPRMYRRARASLARISIANLGGAAGSFWPEIRSAMIDADHARRDHTDSVAMTLAHEATHARFHVAGIRLRRQWRPRIERACVKAELEVAERLNVDETLKDEALRALSGSWWSDKEDDERTRAQLRDLGWSELAIKVRDRLLGNQ
jgi:hypothetical protein